MEKRSGKAPCTTKTFAGETVRKRTLTCRYEPDELAEQHLADAYELLLIPIPAIQATNRQ